MSALVRGGYIVRPHVQAFADDCQEATGVTSYGTYAGHDPSPDRALDIFATRAGGDAVAEFAVDNLERYGITYVIWWQRIYNPSIAPYWRDMADRDSITANHKDHVHISFEPTGPARPEEDDDMFTDKDRDMLRAAVADSKLVHDLHSYMSESKGGIVDTIEEAIAGKVNEINDKLDRISERLAAMEKAKGGRVE